MDPSSLWISREKTTVSVSQALFEIWEDASMIIETEIGSYAVLVAKLCQLLTHEWVFVVIVCFLIVDDVTEQPFMNEDLSFS